MRFLKILIFALLTFSLQGCLTYGRFVKTCQDTPILSQQEALEKFGVPKKIVSLNENVKYHIYPAFFADADCVAYFVNNKLAFYGQDSQRFHLDSQYELGIIDKESYYHERQLLQAEELSRQHKALQILGMYQNQQNTNAILEQASKPVHYSGTIHGSTGESYNYQGTAKTE